MKKKMRLEEMAHKVRVLATLPEGPGSTPGTHKCLTIIVPVTGDFIASSGLVGTNTQSYIGIHTGKILMHIKIKIIIFSKRRRRRKLSVVKYPSTLFVFLFSLKFPQPAGNHPHCHGNTHVVCGQDYF